MSSLSGKKLRQLEIYLFFILLLLAVGLSALSGRVQTRDLFDILFKMRLARALVALAAGASLAASGVVLQSIFRNPMADPYLLGTSSGASFLIALIAFTASRMNFFGAGLYPVAGFTGSLLAVLFVYLLARENGRTPLFKLLLTGIAVSFLLGSVTPVLLAFSGRDLYSVFFFLNGTTQGKSLNESILYGSLAVTGLLLLFLYHRSLDFLWLGEERAYNLGFDFERAKTILLFLSSYLTGMAVAFCGVIGFIGLIIPNMFRSRFRESAFRWLLTSSLFGAIFLIGCDFLARNLFFPRELPLNAITALVGAPYFIYLIRKNADRNP